jgi:hypothetical protein
MVPHIMMDLKPVQEPRDHLNETIRTLDSKDRPRNFGAPMSAKARLSAEQQSILISSITNSRESFRDQLDE